MQAILYKAEEVDFGIYDVTKTSSVVISLLHESTLADQG